VIVDGEGDLLANPFFLARPICEENPPDLLTTGYCTASRSGCLAGPSVHFSCDCDGRGWPCLSSHFAPLPVDRYAYLEHSCGGIVPGEGRAQLARDGVGIHVRRLCAVQYLEDTFRPKYSCTWYHALPVPTEGQSGMLPGAVPRTAVPAARVRLASPYFPSKPH
jgi:hypothetical protein